MNETIAAISTAFGEAAIGVLRVSGADAITLAGKVFVSRQPAQELAPRVQHFGRIVDDKGCTVDEVLLTLFKAPASYTGEEVVEISCHGGILVTRRIYELLLANGARAAEPGEFTQRAFLNGKMDLTQAEAVMDLIHAQSELALQAATQQLEGRLGKTAETLRAEFIALAAHIEAYIDFPDEDIDPDTGASLLARMDALITQLRALLASAEHGRILRNGARTVICGEPNVGKSSLLNLLTGFERAIVSPQAGTTRDTIEEMLHIHGLPFLLVDTAGLRHSADDIEQSGMARTNKELTRADVVLEVVDGSRPRDEAKRVSLPASQRGHILILNKSDLGVHPSWSPGFSLSEETTSANNSLKAELQPCIPLSCETQEGIESLRTAMRDAVWSGSATGNDQLIAINTRHQACFERAANALTKAMEAMRRNEAPEFIALDVREALQAVGEVTGRVDVEEILGAIFASFCIGK